MERFGEQLFEATKGAFPTWQPGTRAAHSHGIGVEGWFQADEPAGRLSTAAIFSGERVPVLVRFSNGSGLRQRYDHANDARGMAVKFWPGEDREMDLVAMSMPVFMVDDGDDFIAFTQQAEPAPAPRPPTRWERLRDLLRLVPPPAVSPFSPPFAPNMKGLLAWAAEHPESRNPIAIMGNLVTPTSYARCAYHGVHTFVLRDAEGIGRPIKYDWSPTAGVRAVDDVTDPRPENYLHAELHDRLAHTDPEFTLQFLLLEDSDPLERPTWKADHARRKRVTAGRLVLTGLCEHGEGCEPLSFNPTRVAPGFELSDDPLLQARKAAYETSFAHRTARGT